MNQRIKSDWQALFTEHKQSGLTAVNLMISLFALLPTINSHDNY